ncbi:hypothetical protein BGY98DRAFT_260678 [Russula aff. rugulosa BPL654]|nr:hypothetical protein BGY98DRAFT_260678 [Russula aff. rugulosa BPL654]
MCASVHDKVRSLFFWSAPGWSLAHYFHSRNAARIRGSSKFINNSSDLVWSSVRSSTTCASVHGTTRSPFSLSTLGCNSTHRFHSPHRRTCPRPSQVWLQLHRLSIVDCTKVQDVRERAPYDAVALFTLLPPKSYSPTVSAPHFAACVCGLVRLEAAPSTSYS